MAKTKTDKGSFRALARKLRKRFYCFCVEDKWYCNPKYGKYIDFNSSKSWKCPNKKVR